MSLRKSPELTPALLAAAQKNAQHSTGPRSPAAKQNSKLNALKHGGYVVEENHRSSRACGMALGEDPEQLQTLTEELMSALGPGDALWEKQIEDLAWLYCRRERLERAQDGLKRRALQAINDWQHRRQQEMARVTFHASQHEMLDYGLSDSTDRGVTLRKTLSYLELVREEVKQGTFRVRQYAVLEHLYTGMKGWRQTLIFRLLHQEAALDRSIDRKVRILLRLRKESGNLSVAPAGQDNGAGMENVEDSLDRDIMPYYSQSVEVVEGSKLTERCGNVTENKGSGLDRQQRSGNLTENKTSYAQNAGMSLKRKGVIGYEWTRPTADGHSTKTPGYSGADGQEIGLAAQRIT